ncbi:GlsB/YeaQ/YmgE family stress response membrane protein [Oricola cellulosilytica]|uniref:GlsB/YeaQ/YmgE family stress response membrane protein n=1 Tax=Oricola cellulosilytica TaxID=1429082 RepID=A0A4R0PAY7_9HYPH|nr:GlsB/YeaQ/YmgE family stress response membrane protein [Oricola cellulosilytica]TCD13138.1 GlsB/YeaQ/YmgE family stress response membrane protein [Oricola cellulosilytica]
MELNGVGWLAAIIIGGLAGWLAEKVMKSDMGLLMNILLGIAGAVVLNALLALLGIGILGTGWIAYLITGFIGACLLIFVVRLVRGRT